MLVFTRRRGDAVSVGEQGGANHVVKVTVLEIRGSNVKLGFEAGNHIAVHRWEVWERICAENLSMSQLPSAMNESTEDVEDNGGM